MDTSEFDNSNNLWSIVWETFENASLTYDLALSGNETKIIDLEENDFVENLTKIGIFTGIFLAWLTEIQLIPAKLDQSIEVIIQRLILILLNVSCFILFTPIVAPILFIFFIYRRIVHMILKISMGKDYAGLLEGTDCVWAIENLSSLSVINVLAILEITDDNSNTNTNLLDDFRNLVEKRLISAGFDKLCWLKEKKYGYYFWRKSDCVNLKKCIRWLDDDDHENCDGACDDISKGYLRKIITNICNKPLPQNHSACWEILIAKNCPKSTINNCQMKKSIPLLFRVHHALGDGVALLRLLLEAIADPKITVNCQNQDPLDSFINQELLIKSENEYKNEQCDQLPILRKCSSVYGNYFKSSNIIYYSNYLLDVSMPFSKIFSLQISFDNLKKYIQEFGSRVIALISIPSCLYYQTLRSMDNNGLHAPALTGEKVISCWMEDALNNTKDCSLLAKIREIKNITGTRFGDVVLAALSVSLNNYFLEIGKASPKSLTVVIPTRMTLPSQKLSLKNGFSVGLLKLCISEVNGVHENYSSGDSSKILDRLYDVTASTDKLRNDPDYLINYWIMKWLCAALPEYFAKPFLQSNSSMIFSNLPGPQTVKILGHTLKKIAFWIPHRGTTGVGFSFLTYGGNIHFSVIADKAIINDENALNKILKSTIHNIEKLHANITRPCF